MNKSRWATIAGVFLLGACSDGGETSSQKPLTWSGGSGGAETAPNLACDDILSCGDIQSGCVQCAVAGLCAAQYESCAQSADCVAVSDCFGACADDTVCQSSCAAKYQAGAAIYRSLTSCVFCNACLNSCDALDACSTGGKTPSVCDQTGVCGDAQSGCIACALADMCAAEADACNDSADCVSYSVCVTECESDGCSDWCAAYYSSGAAIFAELDACVFCRACPITCEGAATSTCE